MAYLYQIKNRLNNKVYIGYTTKTVEERFIEHCKLSESGKGYYLHKAMRKYGTENFEIKVLIESKNLNYIKELEKTYIEKQEGYNIHKGGQGGDTLTKHPDIKKIKKIMSEAHLKNQKRQREHPRYIHISEEIQHKVIEDYYSFVQPSPLVIVGKYSLSSKDIFNRIFKENSQILYRSKIKRFLHNKNNLEKLLDLYLNKKKTVEEIAKETSLHEGSLCKILREELKVPAGNKLHQKL
jgi:group I intron endonuclease